MAIFTVEVYSARTADDAQAFANLLTREGLTPYLSRGPGYGVSVPVAEHEQAEYLAEGWRRYLATGDDSAL